MLAKERLSIRPYHRDDDEFVAALAYEAFDEFTPYAVPHTLGMVRRCTTFVAMQQPAPRGEGADRSATGRNVARTSAGDPPSSRNQGREREGRGRAGGEAEGGEAESGEAEGLEGQGRAAPSSEPAPRLNRVGFAAISDEGDGVVMLNAIAVVRSERGRGIGHFLMLAFERFGRMRGARRLELCTADCNLAAIDLFMRHGFRLVRRRDRFYDRGQDACILVKDLR